MTHYGLNPSFAGPTSVLPLFGDALRRGVPMADGRLRLFDGVPPPEFYPGQLGTTTGAGGVTVTDRAPTPIEMLRVKGRIRDWHGPSVQALQALRPRVLRTLDWSRANEPRDWSRPSVKRWERAQAEPGRGMSVELQAEMANILQSVLWWNAPPRFELSVEEYESRLSELLLELKERANRPPILEYGNELWNAGFAIHKHLCVRAVLEPDGPLSSWQGQAAREIATLKRVADRVFGSAGILGQRPYYLFVGGQLTVPSHLDRILDALGEFDITPDLAGPALYVTPLKAQREEWEAAGAVPTQDELRASCFARLAEIARQRDDSRFIPPGALALHDEMRLAYGVPYFACYEAGQSLIAGRHPWRAAALAAQRTEWMGEIYRAIRREAETAGVDLLCWYSAATQQEPADTRVDVFGLLESTDLSKMLPKALAARGD